MITGLKTCLAAIMAASALLFDPETGEEIVGGESEAAAILMRGE